ncbi:CAP domain-containing protein [Plectosphaerella plurivora]|uniref:CAP domain-containing protein n=1 Tax=Plectosphaerella plurivora TaxID=936078 RepID=A0A9P8VF21_9PEZI|nr:CAP domain-containing protein [Plectosphaerella plurivora]
MRVSTGAIWAAAFLASEASAWGSSVHRRWTPPGQQADNGFDKIAIDHWPGDRVPHKTDPAANVAAAAGVALNGVPAKAAADAVPTVVVNLTTAQAVGIPVAPATPTPTPQVEAGPAPGAGGGDAAKALAAHNAARKEVGLPNDLVWDAGLEADAKQWAQHLTTVGSLVHAGAKTTGQGENLYMSSVPTDRPFDHASELWIAEKSLYRGGSPVGSGNFESYGHYTQIVWRATQKVGIASATDSQGRVFVVARYSPPGNFLDEAPY